MWSTPAVWKQYNKMAVLHFFLVNSSLYILFSMVFQQSKCPNHVLKFIPYSHSTLDQTKLLRVPFIGYCHICIEAYTPFNWFSLTIWLVLSIDKDRLRIKRHFSSWTIKLYRDALKIFLLYRLTRSVVNIGCSYIIEHLWCTWVL